MLYPIALSGGIGLNVYNLTPLLSLSQEAELVSRVPQTHTVDAKAVFDVLKKEAAGSKQDRRAAVDLAIIQESLTRTSARVRWIPHHKMLADPLAKADPTKNSAALEMVLDKGNFEFVDENQELQLRALNPKLKARTRDLSQKQAAISQNASTDTFLVLSKPEGRRDLRKQKGCK